MNLKHLSTFVTVCDRGTVSSAAKHLRITQPALSRQIKALQDELRLRLFDSLGRRLVLTSEGEEFLRHSRALLAQANAVLASGRALGDGRAGILRIGGSPHTLAAYFPAFLKAYNRQSPGVHIKLFEASAAELLAMVERGELHFAITVEVVHGDRFARRPLPPIPVLVLSEAGSQLGAKGTVDVHALDGVPLLLMDRGFATRQTFDAACRLAGVTAPVLFESASLSTLAAFAEVGHGVAIVPGNFRSKGERVHISKLEFRRKQVTLPMAILWDSKKPLPRFAVSFPAMFAAHVRTLMLAA